MFQRVVAAYQRLTHQPRANRRSAVLNVLALEERATPAVAETLLLPIHPPETVLLVTVPTPTAPTAPVVRSDLFCSGAGVRTDYANDLETVLTNDQPPQEKAVGDVKPIAAEDTDTGVTVVIEDMVFVPYVE